MKSPRYGYFDWLCDIIQVDKMNCSWRLLMKDLYQRPFYSLIEHDENRASDGLELREEYMHDMWYPDDVEIEGECSVLEMLIGLARRMDYETSDPYDDNSTDHTVYWFWEMIDNLGLIAFDDDSYFELGGIDNVDNIVDRFLERDYEYDGEGGLFPLVKSTKDQRDVEIWSQMSAYLLEKQAV